MDTRYADFAMAIQQVLAGGMEHYLDAINRNEPKEIPVDVIVRAAKDVVVIERQARGAIDERELLIQRDNLWILTVAQIFLAVNDYPNPRTRTEEFNNRLQVFVDSLARELQ